MNNEILKLILTSVSGLTVEEAVSILDTSIDLVKKYATYQIPEDFGKP